MGLGGGVWCQFLWGIGGRVRDMATKPLRCLRNLVPGGSIPQVPVMKGKRKD